MTHEDAQKRLNELLAKLSQDMIIFGESCLDVSEDLKGVSLREIDDFLDDRFESVKLKSPESIV